MKEGLSGCAAGLKLFCVCVGWVVGKDRLKNDSQVSVGVIYSNREQWMGQFGWGRGSVNECPRGSRANFWLWYL